MLIPSHKKRLFGPFRNVLIKSGDLMKNKQLQILLLMSILALSMMLAQSLIAFDQDEAVTIVLRGKTQHSIHRLKSQGP
jgi:hypothetical protein